MFVAEEWEGAEEVAPINARKGAFPEWRALGIYAILVHIQMLHQPSRLLQGGIKGEIPFPP